MFWKLSSEHTNFSSNRSHEECFSGTELVKYYAVDIKIVFRAFQECTETYSGIEGRC